MVKIAILGCGNMSRAIVLPVAASTSEFEFLTYTPSKTKAISLANEVKGKQFNNIADIPKADVYFIACKPQQFEELAKELKPQLSTNSLVVSVMAAIEIEQLKQKLAVKNIIRIMPNTPMQLSKGIALMYADADEKSIELIHRFFSYCSEVYPMNSERELDIYTLISGCGPAYIYQFAHSLQESFLKLYPTADKKLLDKMTRQLFLGASLMMSEFDTDLATLVANVTSKGGITIEAINIYRQNMPSMNLEALTKALERTEQLSRKSD